MALWLVVDAGPRTKWDEFVVTAPSPEAAKSAAQNFHPDWSDPAVTRLAELRVVDTDNLDGWRFRIQISTDPVTVVTATAPANTPIDQVGQALVNQLNATPSITSAQYDADLNRLHIARGNVDALGDLEVRVTIRLSVAVEALGYRTTGLVHRILDQRRPDSNLGVEFDLDSFVYLPV